MKRHLYIKIFKITIHSFHFFGVMGFISGTILGVVFAQTLELNPIIVLLLSAIGAATFFALAFIAKWIAGEETIVYYHHEIAIMVLCTVALYVLKVSILPYLDIALLGIGVFLAFGRIGCFNVGCCHGRPGKFGYQYGEQHVEAGFTWYFKNITLLPVQLIESAFVFCIVITGSILLFNRAAPGTVLILYTVVYGAFRFIIEFFRGDAERPYWQGLSEAQWTTLLLVTISLILSMAGYLPFYNWHWMIFISLVIISSYVMFVRSKTNDYILLSPKHVEQIATALQYHSNTENNLLRPKNISVKVFTTNKGLSISSGYHQNGNQQVQHCTLSGNTKLNLDVPIANKIAKTICLLTRYHGEFELIERENGIYHIIYKGERQPEKLSIESTI